MQIIFLAKAARNAPNKGTNLFLWISAEPNLLPLYVCDIYVCMYLANPATHICACSVYVCVAACQFICAFISFSIRSL